MIEYDSVIELYTRDIILTTLYRYNAYIGIGFLAVATGPDIQKYLRHVLTSISMCLPPAATSSAPATSSKNTKKRDTHLDPAVFACVSMLARAVKHSIKHEVSRL